MAANLQTRAIAKLVAAALLCSVVLVGALWIAWWAKEGYRAVSNWLVIFFLPALTLATMLSPDAHDINPIIVFGAQTLELFVLLFALMYAVRAMRRALGKDSEPGSGHVT